MIRVPAARTNVLVIVNGIVEDGINMNKETTRVPRSVHTLIVSNERRPFVTIVVCCGGIYCLCLCYFDDNIAKYTMHVCSTNTYSHFFVRCHLISFITFLTP